MSARNRVNGNEAQSGNWQREAAGLIGGSSRLADSSLTSPGMAATGSGFTGGNGFRRQTETHDVHHLDRLGSVANRRGSRGWAEQAIG